MKRNLIVIMVMMVFAFAVLVTGCAGKTGEKVTPFTIPAELKGTVQADINGDGSAEEIGFEKIADEYISQELILTIDGKDYDLTEGIYFFPDDDLKCFMIRNNGKDKPGYLYIQQTAENDYQSVTIYKYTGNEMEYVDGFDGAVDFRRYSDADNYEEISLTDPEDFQICYVEQVMSTMSVIEKCRMGDDGRPAETGDYRYYITGENWNITSKTAIPAGILKDEKAKDETQGTLAGGVKVTPFRTDGKSFIDLKADGEDGIYRIYYQDDDGPIVIIDKSGSQQPGGFMDCFDGLMFAG